MPFLDLINRIDRDLWISANEAEDLTHPDTYGLPSQDEDVISGVPEDKVLEMVKVAFMLVLATWMTACLMAIIYSHEIAVFIVERSQ